MNQKTRVHRFDESLEFSHRAADLPMWEDIYRKAFPGFLGMHDHRDDGPHQRNGVDRSIILKNSKQILIDEKKRRVAYDDIALEYLADKARGEPGWVCKPLTCDYIAYAVVPLGIAYLMPVIQLQSAWAVHGQKWIQSYKKIEAHNEYHGRKWVTISVPVPVKVLWPAIGDALRVNFAWRSAPIEDDGINEPPYYG